MRNNELHSTKRNSPKYGRWWISSINGRCTTEYISFSSAKGRCNNPNNTTYKHYGGRGIKFLFDSFDEFMDEIGPKPEGNFHLDRIDNNGHYEPGNVRWVPSWLNQRNKRDTLSTAGMYIRLVDGSNAVKININFRKEVSLDFMRKYLEDRGVGKVCQSLFDQVRAAEDEWWSIEGTNLRYRNNSKPR